MQIAPRAVGQSSDLIVFWDDNPDVGVLLPRTTQVVSELSFGFGMYEEAPCLVVYLFIAEQALEFVLPRVLPTSPQQSIDVWHLLANWRSDVWKLRYGDNVIDDDREVTLLLPTAGGASLLDKLRLFVEQSAEKLKADPFQRDALEELKEILSLVADKETDLVEQTGGDDHAFREP